jgi:hypothetical protein
MSLWVRIGLCALVIGLISLGFVVSDSAQVSGPNTGVSTACGVEGVDANGNCKGTSSSEVSTNNPTGGGGPTNFLLIQTGSALLINAGSKFKIQ